MCIIAGYFLISRFNTENKSEEIRIIGHFNKDVISGNVLTTQVNDIKDKNIRKLFARFDVVELQAAFTNRYNDKGFLKPDIKTSATGTWQKIILKDNSRAEKLVAKLKNEKGVITTYIEKPIWTRYDEVLSANLTITRFDTIVTGTFKAVVSNGTNTLEITEGKFDYTCK